jgi:hypothetical protein
LKQAPTDSIRELYPYAFAEGEGVGTAYEYVAKARFVRDLRRGLRPGARLLVAGLPERYGTSLDFAILAHSADAELVVLDERAEALDRARAAVETVQRDGRLVGLRATYRRLASLDALGEEGHFDAVLTCEVLQRVPAPGRPTFAKTLQALASRGALFVPNGDNPSHVEISGLSGVTRRELEGLFAGSGHRFAYVDMPPFPPGITRSATQRARAATGFMEAAAMEVLDAYCAAERFVPDAVKRRVAHIVCVAWGT